jgi:hypothetical protein
VQFTDGRPSVDELFVDVSDSDEAPKPARKKRPRPDVSDIVEDALAKMHAEAMRLIGFNALDAFTKTDEWKEEVRMLRSDVEARLRVELEPKIAAELKAEESVLRQQMKERLNLDLKMEKERFDMQLANLAEDYAEKRAKFEEMLERFSTAPTKEDYAERWNRAIDISAKIGMEK